TLLGDGTVLITGGGTGVSGTWTSLNSAEIYTPSVLPGTPGTFTPVSNPMNAARWQHTATLLGDGTVLLAGGFNGTATWTPAPLRREAGDEGWWSPAGGSVEATAELSTAGGLRVGPSMAGRPFAQSASLLTAGPNAGDALMVGGFGGVNPGVPVNTSELYSPT